MQWIVDNVEWLFGGIGVAVLGGIVGLIFKKKDYTQKIESGKKSKNNQAGRDLTITSQKDGDSNEK